MSRLEEPPGVHIGSTYDQQLTYIQGLLGATSVDPTTSYEATNDPISLLRATSKLVQQLLDTEAPTSNHQRMKQVLQLHAKLLPHAAHLPKQRWQILRAQMAAAMPASTEITDSNLEPPIRQLELRVGLAKGMHHITCNGKRAAAVMLRTLANVNDSAIRAVLMLAPLDTPRSKNRYDLTMSLEVQGLAVQPLAALHASNKRPVAVHGPNTLYLDSQAVMQNLGLWDSVLLEAAADNDTAVVAAVEVCMLAMECLRSCSPNRSAGLAVRPGVRSGVKLMQLLLVELDMDLWCAQPLISADVAAQAIRAAGAASPEVRQQCLARVNKVLERLHGSLTRSSRPINMEMQTAAYIGQNKGILAGL